MNCSICYEPLHTLLCSIPCGHVYHRGCFQDWYKRNRTCPDCRTRVEDVKDICFLFFEAAPTAPQPAAPEQVVLDESPEESKKALQKELFDKDRIISAMKSNERVLRQSLEDEERAKASIMQQCLALQAKLTAVEIEKATLLLSKARCGALEKRMQVLTEELRLLENDAKQLRSENTLLSTMVNFQDGDVCKLQGRLDTLQCNPQAMQELIKSSDWMAREYKKLKEKYDALQRSMRELAAENDKLVAANRSLSTNAAAEAQKYASLLSIQQQLERDYDELLSTHRQCEGVRAERDSETVLEKKRAAHPSTVALWPLTPFDAEPHAARSRTKNANPDEPTGHTDKRPRIHSSAGTASENEDVIITGLRQRRSAHADDDNDSAVGAIPFRSNVLLSNLGSRQPGLKIAGKRSSIIQGYDGFGGTSKFIYSSRK